MKKLKQKIYLNSLKNNLGKIEETSNKFICYVEEDKLKNFEDQRWYHFVFSENKLNKPIYIVFENIEFSPYKSIIIDSCDNIHFIFENCLFDGQIDIGYAESIQLENNQYFNYTPFTHFYYFFKGKIKNLKITNEHFSMSELASSIPYLFLLELDTLEINNTSIMLPECNGKINFCANKMYIINSIIKTNNSIQLLSKESNLIGNKIESKSEVVINGKVNGSLKEQIKAPTLKYNGVDITEEVFEYSKPKQLTKK